MSACATLSKCKKVPTLDEQVDLWKERGFNIEITEGYGMFGVNISSNNPEVIFESMNPKGIFNTKEEAQIIALNMVETIFEKIKDTPNYNETIKQLNDYYNLPF